LIRLWTIQGFTLFAYKKRRKLLLPLLNDPMLAIRQEPASVLVTYFSQLSNAQRQQLSVALNDYIMIQKFNTDRGANCTNIGYIYRAHFRLVEAENSA
jgi:hypothetical protein